MNELEEQGGLWFAKRFCPMCRAPVTGAAKYREQLKTHESSAPAVVQETPAQSSTERREATVESEVNAALVGIAEDGKGVAFSHHRLHAPLPNEPTSDQETETNMIVLV
jgi:hypothetical protein